MNVSSLKTVIGRTILTFAETSGSEQFSPEFCEELAGQIYESFLSNENLKSQLEEATEEDITSYVRSKLTLNHDLLDGLDEETLSRIAQSPIPKKKAW